MKIIDACACDDQKKQAGNGKEGVQIKGAEVRISCGGHRGGNPVAMRQGGHKQASVGERIGACGGLKILQALSNGSRAWERKSGEKKGEWVHGSTRTREVKKERRRRNRKRSQEGG